MCQQAATAAKRLGCLLVLTTASLVCYCPLSCAKLSTEPEINFAAGLNAALTPPPPPPGAVDKFATAGPLYGLQYNDQLTSAQTLQGVHRFAHAANVSDACTDGALVDSNAKSRIRSTSGSGKKVGYNATVVGVGSAVPPTIISNFDLEKIVNTSDAWISQRTGISRRRVLLAHESLQDLAATAATRALLHARVDPSEVDAVIVATSSPEDMFGDATSVAGRIGAYRAVGWDIRAACSGFVFSIIDAAQYMENNVFTTVVVVGSDALSRWVDWTDRNVCILFGDGAGAVVMQTVDRKTDSGLLAFTMRSDPRGHDHLHLQRDASISSPCTTSPPASVNAIPIVDAAVLQPPQQQNNQWLPIQKAKLNTI
eukprot:Lankesteria_metandrocarpae@DN5520_c0_g1_i1.p1